jgi:transposase
LAEVLGNYEGYVISDRYGAYNYSDENKRQICWSHLQRDFERFAHSLHPELLKKGNRLVEISQKVFSLVGNYIRDPIGKVKLSSKVIKLKDELKEILESILKLSGTKHAHGVAGSLLKIFGMMRIFRTQ